MKPYLCTIIGTLLGWLFVPSMGVTETEAVFVRGKEYRNWYAYYDIIKSVDQLKILSRYDMIAVQPANVVIDMHTFKQYLSNVTVLAYISLGEQNGGTLQKGEGDGPVQYDAVTKKRVYTNKGIASYYIDIDNDGVADHQADWKSYYVDPINFAWRSKVITALRNYISLGYQGAFLDTPEVASPWDGRGWTAEGIYRLCEDLRTAFPDAIYLFNRGLFFWSPINIEQFQWRPTRFIDFLLVESFEYDSNYNQGMVNPSPYFATNYGLYLPHIIADIKRSENTVGLLVLDYAQYPAKITTIDSYQKWYDIAVNKHGMLACFQTKCVCDLNTVFLDNKYPIDKEAPTWGSTGTGLQLPIVVDEKTLWQANHKNSVNISRLILPGREGLQKVLMYDDLSSKSMMINSKNVTLKNPNPTGVQLQWDISYDRDAPVIYDVYVAIGSSVIDIQKAPVGIQKSSSGSSGNVPFTQDGVYAFTNVKPTMPYNYVYPYRTFVYNEDVYPYAFNVNLLRNCVTYTFLVRAADRSCNVENNMKTISARYCNGVMTISSAYSMINEERNYDFVNHDESIDEQLYGVKSPTNHPCYPSAPFNVLPKNTSVSPKNTEDHPTKQKSTMIQKTETEIGSSCSTKTVAEISLPSLVAMIAVCVFLF